MALTDGGAQAAEEAHDEIQAGMKSRRVETGLLAARVALWERDRERAAHLLEADLATGARGPAVRQGRAVVAAGIAALEGRPGEALPMYVTALRGWRELGLPWDEALTAIDMAMLLDPSEPDVIAAARSAREILVRLGAKPFLARLEAALVRTAAGSRPGLRGGVEASSVGS